jgi:large subunit ribosomal protein L30
MDKLKVTLRRSTICAPKKIKDTVKALGLRKLNRSVVINNVPAMRGLVKKCIHLVEVEEVK